MVYSHSMATEKISRRGLIKGFAASVIAGDLAYSDHMFTPRIKVDESLYKILIPEAKAIKDSIEFNGFDEPFNIKGQSTFVRPIPQAFAQVISQLAYIDGGLNELKATSDFLQKRGLIIEAIQNSYTEDGRFNGAAALVVIPKIGIGNSIIEGYRAKKSSDEVIWHEIYHLLQVTRNPLERLTSLGGDALVVFGSMGLSFKKTIEVFEKRWPRRQFLKYSAAFVAAVVADQIAVKVLRPTEAQTYLQIENISREKSMDNQRGSLFSFEPV